MSNRSLWVNFATLRQESWHRGNVVLLGDAAHTAHFSIGSGTKLAMEDSIALVDALRRHGDLAAALNDYEMERQPMVERFQEAALESSSYFEHVSRYAHFDPRQFAFNLLTRSRRITYINLTQRDPELVRTVDSWFAAAATGSPDGAVRLSPPPMFTPFRIGQRSIPNRVAVAAGSDLEAAARLGAGLVITEFVSVTEDGRITPETPVIDRAEQDNLRSAVERIHRAGSRVALQLGHAGRRGSMRPRSQGVDRPLRQGGWRLMAASPIAYTPDGARHRTCGEGLRPGGKGGGGLRARCLGAELRAGISRRRVHLAAHQSAQRRIRRFAREPHALSPPGPRRGPRGLGAAAVDTDLCQRLGRWRVDPG